MQFTTTQLLKLIAFCAVGLAVPMALTTPGAPGRFQWTFVGLGSLMLVPLAWAALALAIVARGRGRDRLVVGLVLLALTTLVAALLVLAVMILRLHAQGQPVGSAGAPWILLAVVLGLLGLWVLLAAMLRRTWAGPTPEPEPRTTP